MAEMVSNIPIVDFGAMSLERETRPNPGDESVVKVVKELHDAFSTIGFVYLKNHGISQEQVDDLFKVSDAFFQLSPEVKAKSSKTVGTSSNGYDSFEREATNPERPGNLKEGFDASSVDTDGSVPWPDADLPEFSPAVKKLFKQCKELGRRVLSAMAMGLGLDPDAFLASYQHMGTSESCTMLRINYYNRLDDRHIKTGQIRCGEHTDYMGITLLFQDQIGGLEVQNLNGEFVSAEPIRGTVVINIADLMQRWTADKLKSTVHRVLVPEEESKLTCARQSVAFFCGPDRNAEIKCLDGSEKYPTILAGDYLKGRLADTYKY